MSHEIRRFQELEEALQLAEAQLQEAEARSQSLEKLQDQLRDLQSKVILAPYYHPIQNVPFHEHPYCSVPAVSLAAWSEFGRAARSHAQLQI